MGIELWWCLLSFRRFLFGAVLSAAITKTLLEANLWRLGMRTDA